MQSVRPPKQDMSTSQEPYMALIQAMTREIGMTTELKGLDPQFHRRLLVRVIFSTLEGYAFHLRKQAFEAGQTSKYAFSKGDLERLTERKEKPQPDGSIKEQTFYLPSLSGLRFSIAIFARIMGVPEPPPPRPGDLEAAFAVRDRLTHPKNAASFAISSADAEVLARLGAWFSTVAEWYLTTELSYINRLKESIPASTTTLIAEFRAKVKGPAA
jgi:hypothetical protein